MLLARIGNHSKGYLQLSDKTLRQNLLLHEINGYNLRTQIPETSPPFGARQKQISTREITQREVVRHRVTVKYSSSIVCQ